MLGKVFRKPVERHERGTGPLNYQTWRVTTDLGGGIFGCTRVDSTNDPMGAASPQKRTFKEKDILHYLNNKPDASNR